MKKMNEIKHKIKSVIGDGNLEEAFKLTEDFMRNDSVIQNDFIHLKGRYSENKKNVRNRTLDDEKARLENNRISKSLLELLDILTEVDFLHSDKSLNEKKRELIYASYKVAGSKVLLSNIYVEPYFDVFHKNLKAPGNVKEKYINVFPQITIHSFFEEIFNENSLGLCSGLTCSNPRFIIIEGYPGQGKTSFCYRLEYDLAKAYKKNTVFFSLQRVTDIEEFAKKPFEYIKFHRKQGLTDFSSTVIILDGLSEIIGISKDYIDKLIRNLANDLDEHYPETHVILTSRYFLINSEEFDEDSMLFLALAPFDDNQQKQWKNKYCYETSVGLSSAIIESNLTELKSSNPLLEELAGIPSILLYFSKEFETTTEAASINPVDLFNYVISRKWTDKNKITSIKEISHKDLLLFFQFLASIIQRQPSESVLLSSISIEIAENKDSFPNDFIVKYFKGSDPELAVRILLSLFYIKEVAESGKPFKDYYVQFFGKHIQAYLLAQFIYETELVSNMPIISAGEKEGVRLAANQALNVIWRSFVHPPLSHEAIHFLCEIAEEKDEDDIDKRRLIKNIKAALPVVVENQLLYKYDVPGFSTPPIDKCLDGFHSLWRFLIRLNPEENWISPDILKEFVNLIRLDEAINGRTFDLSYQNLREANFSNIVFEEEIFDFAKLEYSNFESATFIAAGQTSMNNVSAERAKYNRAILRGLEIKDSFFKLAEFREADLSNSVASGSDFSLGDMEKANMSAGDFTGAAFVATKMQGVNLSTSAKLNGAIMEGADLAQADLSGADLSGAILDNALMSEANLNGITIDRQTSFANVDLSYANLHGIRGVPQDVIANILSEALTLYGARRSMHPDLIELVLKKNPLIFSHPSKQALDSDESEQDDFHAMGGSFVPSS
jgi:uncharacterized protein YjbI with pentapeptide repeats